MSSANLLTNKDNGTDIITNERNFSQQPKNLDQMPTSRSNDRDEQDKTKAPKKREVYRYQTDWLVSSIAWSNEISNPYKLALTSYAETYTNHVQIVKLNKDANDEEITCMTSFEHPYPATKILWLPQNQEGNLNFPPLLATTADYLRLWRLQNVDDDNYQSHLSKSDSYQVKLECLMNPNQSTKLCAPLTSFDWNEVDPRIIITASVDATCAVWDIEASKPIETGSVLTSHSPSSNKIQSSLRSQLVAHDHQVYDVSFSRFGTGRDVFASAGGDGSVRLFDLRKLSTSTVLFEDTKTNINGNVRAFVRVQCSKQDANMLATFSMDSNEIILLDTRHPGRPLAILGNHTSNLNSISWAPNSAHHICSGSDDCQALIWDISKLPNPIEQPLLAYRANSKINVINWSASHPDWIAIGYENFIELLRV